MIFFELGMVDCVQNFTLCLSAVLTSVLYELLKDESVTLMEDHSVYCLDFRTFRLQYFC